MDREWNSKGWISIMSKANYESYKAAYRKKQNMLTAKGLQMYDSMKTKEEFEAIYEATRNDLKQLVKEVKRKVIGNVTQTIVTEQTYEYTQKQGKALAEYAKATGQNLTQQQIRAGQLDFSFMEDRYAELKNELRELGLSRAEIATEAGIIIGQEYFGSE